jgi:hypothetical protein
LLDLVHSNLKNLSVNKSVNPLIPCDIYHLGLLISVPIVISESIEYNLCMYNFFSCNYADITFSSASIDWNKLFKDLSINEAVDLFYSIIYDFIDIFALKIIKRQCYYPPWLV